jgi:hypothetical protein
MYTTSVVALLPPLPYGKAVEESIGSTMAKRGPLMYEKER